MSHSHAFLFKEAEKKLHDWVLHSQGVPYMMVNGKPLEQPNDLLKTAPSLHWANPKTVENPGAQNETHPTLKANSQGLPELPEL